MTQAERIGPALGKIPSGLFVATATINQGAKNVGMLCSFVEQAGFQPPMISMAVGHGRPVSPEARLDGDGAALRTPASWEKKTPRFFESPFARGDNPACVLPSTR